MDKNLYKVRTKGNLEFYVVTETWNDAANLVADALDESDYGFDSNREVSSVELVRSEHFFAGKRFFSGGEKNYFIVDNRNE